MAITWRNVDAPDLRGVGSLMNQSVQSFQDGTDQFNSILNARMQAQQDNWNKQKESNTLNAVNQINQMQDLNQLKATNPAALVAPYGAQVDAKTVLDALGNQRGKIVNNLQSDAAVKTLQDEQQYGGLYAQARQAFAAGDMTKGQALAAQLQGTSYGDDIATDLATANQNAFDRKYKEQQLGLQRASLAASNAARNDQLTERNELVGYAKQVDKVRQDAIASGRDPDTDVQKYLRGVGASATLAMPKLLAYVDATKERTALAPEEQANVVAGLSQYSTVGNNIKAAAEGTKADVRQRLGLDPAYEASVAAGETGKPVDIAKLVGDGDGQIPQKIYTYLKDNVKGLNPATELPYAAAMYDTTLGVSNKEELAKMLNDQRGILKQVKEQDRGIAGEVNKASADLAKQMKVWANSASTAYRSGDTTTADALLNNAGRDVSYKISSADDVLGATAKKKLAEEQDKANADAEKQATKAQVARLLQQAQSRGANTNPSGLPFNQPPTINASAYGDMNWLTPPTYAERFPQSAKKKSK